MKIATVFLALCVSTSAGAQTNPSRAEINEAAKKLKTEQAQLAGVTVWETPTSFAEYGGG